jgi:hypothetical protein
MMRGLLLQKYSVCSKQIGRDHDVCVVADCAPPHSSALEACAPVPVLHQLRCDATPILPMVPLAGE